MATSPLAPLSEQRQAQRSAIAVLRAAKLITQAGEYVCLVRDVSTGGVRLQLFHPLPDEEHVFLELGNGEVHPLIRAWVKERQAGFRFLQPVSVADFLAEAGTFPRRSLRLHVRRPGMVYSGGLVRPVELCDLSQTGAHFTCRDYLALFQPLILSIEGMPECQGWVRWRRGQDYGMVFETGHRLDQLAQHALALQPLPDAALTPAMRRA